MNSPSYFLGCPVWAVAAWKGSVFASDAPRREWLRQYSSMFSTVEGNSAFYAIPTPETAQRWVEESSPGFQFALKFPRTISHERRLVDVSAETRAFLRVLEILQQGERLGPTFLQLPPDLGAGEFETLSRYLRGLPRQFPYAVEVRHRDYFDEGPHELPLNELLTTLGIDRVLFDSRPLFSAPPDDETERVSQSRKPRSPLRWTTTGQQPFARIIGRNRVEPLRPWLDEWAMHVAGWIEAGLKPYVFTHTPDDAFAPQMASAFHALLRERLPDLPPLPEWPGERERRQRRQKSLF